MNDRRIPPSRRTLLKAGALLPTIAMPSLVRAQSGTLKIGVILPLTGVLAFPGQHVPNVVFSMTYRHAASTPHAGELGAGGSVDVKKKGTVFNVTRTVQS